MAQSDPIISWNQFSKAITGLNAKEAFLVVVAIEPNVRCKYMSFPPKSQPIEMLPTLLVNYAFAQGDIDNVRRFDQRKVQAATATILGTRFKHANDYVVKLNGRVEFQDPDIILEMPSNVDSIYDRATHDAEEGSAKGFAWACFRLNQAFMKPSTSLFTFNEALDLHDALGDIPGVVIDTYGEAGLDVAMQMEKMHGKIGAMPLRPM